MLFAAAFEDVDDTSIPWGLAWAYNGLGRLCYAQGADSQAWGYFQQALQSALNAPSIPEMLDVLTGMAMVLARGGQTAEAIRLLYLPLYDARHRQLTLRRAQQLAEVMGIQTAEANLPSGLPQDVQAYWDETIRTAQQFRLPL